MSTIPQSHYRKNERRIFREKMRITIKRSERVAVHAHTEITEAFFRQLVLALVLHKDLFVLYKCEYEQMSRLF